MVKTMRGLLWVTMRPLPVAWSAPPPAARCSAGDAIADPLTVLEAAAAVLDSLTRGGGEFIDVTMVVIVATYASLPVTDLVDNRPAVSTSGPNRRTPTVWWPPTRPNRR